MMLADSATERDTFLAVVYADADWLRAEFDAIVAASWEEPPSRPEPCGRAGPSGPDAPRHPDRPVPIGRSPAAAAAPPRPPPGARS